MKSLKCNRPFVTLRNGFVKEGDVIKSDHPEFKRLLAGAIEQANNGDKRPVWIILENGKEAAKEATPDPVEAPADSKEEAPAHAKEEIPEKGPAEVKEEAPAEAPKKKK